MVIGMEENFLRFLMLAVFISGTLAIAAVSGEISSYSLSEPFESYYPVMEFSNVTELLDAMPLEEYVSVSGTVSHLEDDYVSENGYEYQRFFISDSRSEVKVFCSKKGGSVSIEKGDNVFLSGKLQSYYQILEIYTECPSVNVI